MMQKRLFLTILSILTALCGTGFGETLVLKQGGRVEGTILNPAGAQEPETYRIRTRTGIEMEISSDQVEYVVHPGGAYEQYDKKVKLMADSVEGNLTMANWCKSNNLSSLADRHYRRILELEPDNKEARRELGYIWHEGAWTTPDEAYTAMGMVKYKGRWIYPQEKEILENRKSNQQAQNQWRKQVIQWRDDLFGKKHEQALAGLMGITDPDAVPALGQVLSSDRRAEARLIYIKALGKLGTPDAMKVLGQSAMNDPLEEVRLSCLDQLKQHQAQAAVDYFSVELKSKNNARVNRAGELIGEIGDMNAVPALIAALVTQHKYTIAGGPGMSASQGTDGVSGLTMGGGPKTILKTQPNLSVLNALQKITNQNFGYDKAAWTRWYSRNKQGGVESNLRRKEEGGK